MTLIGRAVVICAGALVGALASFLLGHTHPFGNAGLYASRYAPTEIMEHAPVPPEVRAILTAKCADCHSAETRAPLYGRFTEGFDSRDLMEPKALASWAGRIGLATS